MARSEADKEALSGIRDLVDPRLVNAYELLLGDISGRTIDDPDVRCALIEHGMARPPQTGSPVLRAVDPVTAFETVVLRRQRHLVEQQECLAAAQRSAFQLRQKTGYGHRAVDAQTVIRPENAAAVATTMAELATGEYLSVHTGIPARDVPGPRGRKVRHRAIYGTGCLVTGRTGARTRSAGCQVRTLAQPGIDLRIADRSCALLPLGSPTADDWLYIQSPAVVGGLRQYFDLLWDQAVPLGDGLPEPGDKNRHIVTLLGHGLKDEAIARQLNLTLRTVRRRIAAIHANLGVTSRFAAGAAAERRGWLTR